MCLSCRHEPRWIYSGRMAQVGVCRFGLKQGTDHGPKVLSHDGRDVLHLSEGSFLPLAKCPCWEGKDLEADA
jgi:hypothetical protein